MTDKEKKHKKNAKPVTEASLPLHKVSKIIFDEATGTLTLKLASEEEIAEAEKMNKEKEAENK